jgi:hypothetical protein
MRTVLDIAESRILEAVERGGAANLSLEDEY